MRLRGSLSQNSTVFHAVDCSVKIRPTPADLDVCLVGVPLADDNSLASVEALWQLGRVLDSPSVNGCVIDGDAALCHHLFQILALGL
jgi:hypothetical protein